MSLLRIEDLSQSYGGARTLWGVDLDVAEGTRLCLMGRNGMGKTTLLKCLMGLIPVTSGTIAFDGVDLLARSPETRARLGIGYVPQGRRSSRSSPSRRTSRSDWPHGATAGGTFRRVCSSCFRS